MTAPNAANASAKETVVVQIDPNDQSQLEVQINSMTPVFYHLATLSSLTIQTGTGFTAANNVIEVLQLPKSVTLTLEQPGPGQVILGDNSNLIAGVQGQVIIANSGKADTALILHDSADPANVANNVTIDGDQVPGGNPPGITGLGGGVSFGVGNLSSIEIDGGHGTDTYTVNSTALPTPLTINVSNYNKGDGTTTVNISSPVVPNGKVPAGSGNLKYIKGLVTINPVTTKNPKPPPATVYGTVKLNINGTNTPPNNGIGFTKTGFTGTDPVTVNYTNIQSVTFYGSPSNAYNIQAVQAGTSLIIDPASGANTFNITPAALASVSFIGTNPVPLTIDASGITAPTTYTFTATALQINDGPPIPYGNISSLTLLGGSGSNTYTVMDTPTGIPLTIDTGSGADVVHVLASHSSVSIMGGSGHLNVAIGTDGSKPVGTAGSLANIDGNVDVEDPTGTAQLAVDDGANNGINVATLTPGMLTGLAPATITWRVSNVQIYGGSFNSLYYVNGVSAAPTTTQLNPGNGSDTIYVTQASPNFTLNVGTGSYSVILNSSAAGSPFDTISGLAITGSSKRVSLAVNDTGDTTPRTVSLTASGIKAGPNAASIVSLSPTQLSGIGYAAGLNTMLAVNLSGSTASLSVGNTGTNSQTAIDLEQITGNFTFTNQGTGQVSIGQSSHTAQNVQGNLTLQNSGPVMGLAIDDSADPTARQIHVSPTAIQGLFTATGNGVTLNLTGLDALTLDTSLGSTIAVDQGYNLNTTLNTRGGTVTLNSLAAGSTLQVNGAAGPTAHGPGGRQPAERAGTAPGLRQRVAPTTRTAGTGRAARRPGGHVRAECRSAERGLLPHLRRGALLPDSLPGRRRDFARRPRCDHPGPADQLPDHRPVRQRAGPKRRRRHGGDPGQPRQARDYGRQPGDRGKRPGARWAAVHQCCGERAERAAAGAGGRHARHPHRRVRLPGHARPGQQGRQLCRGILQRQHG